MSKKTNMDFRTNTGAVASSRLVEAYQNLSRALQDRTETLLAAYSNKGTPLRVRRQKSNKDLAEIIGVSSVVSDIGWRGWRKPKTDPVVYVTKREPILLAVIEDDFGNKRKINVDAVIPLLALFDEARAAGIKVRLNSAFRTHEEQKTLWNKRVEYLKNPVAYVNKYGTKAHQTAYPGTSNHQMGLAFDLNSEGSGVLSSQQFFANVGPKYGWYRTVASEAHHFEFVRSLAYAPKGEEDEVFDLISAVTEFLAQPLPSTTRTAAEVVRGKLDATDRARVYLKAKRGDFYTAADQAGGVLLVDDQHGTREIEYAAAAEENVKEEASTPISSDSPYVFNFTSGLWGDGKWGGKV